MLISQNGVDFIKGFEGLSLEAYIDTHDQNGAPIYAIGYGHRYDAGPPKVTPGMSVTLPEAERILKQDLVPYEAAVNRCVHVPLTQNQFDALTSFAYNAGPGSLKQLVADSGLNEGVMSKVPAALLHYNTSQGKVLNGLTRRREAEGVLFTK